VELVAGGRRLFAATGGRDIDAARPLVVLLHGAGMDHTVWALQARYLAHHGRSVAALDLPGHGRSEGPALRSVAEMAELVLAAVAAAGAGPACLVGHSMGALIALEAASRRPEAVRGLALLGFAPRMPVHADLLGAAERGEHTALDLMTSWAIGRRAQLGRNDAPGLWLTGATLRLLERADPRALAADLAACNAYAGAEGAAAKLAAPLLLVLGADDRMTPPGKALDFAGAVSGARSRVLPGAGHMMMLEDPAGTLAALEKFV
jgi:pimeloyl-ACP methyl ester carboxylesterase